MNIKRKFRLIFVLPGREQWLKKLIQDLDYAARQLNIELILLSEGNAPDLAWAAFLKNSYYLFLGNRARLTQRLRELTEKISKKESADFSFSPEEIKEFIFNRDLACRTKGIVSYFREILGKLKVAAGKVPGKRRKN